MATKENVKVTNFYPDSDCIVLEIDGIFVNVSRDEDGDVYVQAIDGNNHTFVNLVLGEGNNGETDGSVDCEDEDG